MRDPLPDIVGPHYDRPNQPWVCGHAEAGHACAPGPTARGLCPALAECHPRREGDRWECNRSELRGGPCDEGPAPDGMCACVQHCQPVRTLRAKRGRFAVAITTLVVGSLLVLLNANWRDAVISPGPLSQHHAQLLEGEKQRGALSSTDSNCAMCHASANSTALAWTATAIGIRAHENTQSEQCMKCHSTTIVPELALTAHNISTDVLEKISAVARDGISSPGAGIVSAVANVSPPPNENVACATCHREHHGTSFDLTAMTSSACQACHQQRYESFATDHPDFGDWPYDARTPIAFDHVSHGLKHFVEKDQPFDCRRCHVADATQTVELLTGYETACASCHDEKIATSVARGVPMLVLPTLDIEALQKAGFLVGPWPKHATGDFDGRLPPMMKLLLAADPSAAQAMSTLGADFEFLDVDPEDDAQLKACAELAAAIRTLVAELAARGPVVVSERLTTSLAIGVSEQQATTLVSGLSQDTFQIAARAWLLDSSPDETAWATPSITAKTSMSPTFGPSGSWSYDAATFTLSYQPTTHADPVLASWLSLLVDAPTIEERPHELAMLHELAKSTAPGLCASCHSIERGVDHGDDQRLAIHWTARDRGAARTFTKFSHGPHVILPQLADCTACHALGPSATGATSHADWTLDAFTTEFLPMTKQQCAACHTAKAAGDRCQQCHHYHVEAVEPWRLKEGAMPTFDRTIHPMSTNDARRGEHQE